MADKLTSSDGINIGVGVVWKQNLTTALMPSLEKFKKVVEEKGTISLKVKTDTSGAKQEIQTFTNACGDYVKTLTKYNAQGKMLSKEIIEVGTNAKKASEMIAKAEERKRKEAEKSAQILQRAQEKEDRIRQQQAEKAEREAKRQAEAEQKALARATAQAQKEAEDKINQEQMKKNQERVFTLLNNGSVSPEDAMVINNNPELYKYLKDNTGIKNKIPFLGSKKKLELDYEAILKDQNIPVTRKNIKELKKQLGL